MLNSYLVCQLESRKEISTGLGKMEVLCHVRLAEDRHDLGGVLGSGGGGRVRDLSLIMGREDAKC